MPMKAEVKEKWVKALRSREFKQTDGCLKKELKPDKFGYCCLGVLHEIDGGKWRKEDYCKDFYTRSKSSYNSSDTDLIGKKFARGLTKEQKQTLINMNDDQDKKFYEIANWIEKTSKPEIKCLH